MDQQMLYKLYKSRQTMVSMLRYRKYEISESFDLSLDQFKQKYETSTVEEIKHALNKEFIIEGTDKLPTIMIMWLTKPKLGANIQDCANEMTHNKIRNAVMIVDVGITAQAKEAIKFMTSRKLSITVMLLSHTIVFPPDHDIAAKHEICSSEECMLVLEKFGISPNDGGILVPHIQIDDIMVVHLGARKNQLIRITRKDKTIHYRIVVSS